ncbi:MFS transporter [Bordetella genomosp. 12]|uniref:MFS transporter n=1 Tax=Bordetella genomosp. 12 TaxID=463035 RepID=A0A261VLC2_9BORD|nr:MFS transporter [Bordetella genomosp. 12]OZI74859.1 MFS transporter [Bordetella genomosp. 12]
MSTLAAAQKARKAGIAAFIGTVLEWYDFIIYGTAAAIVLNRVFFPNSDPTVGTLAAFATYAVGFLARPLGGLFLGYLGDKVGRKSVLVLTLFLMGGATTAIGLLPGYDTIGVWAPALLVLMRLIQGFGAGGEYAGAVVLSVEHAQKGKRGAAGAWAPLGFAAATLFANAVFFFFLTVLSEEQFMAWGWRIPFLLGAACMLVGYLIRRNIEEPPAFEKAQQAGQVKKIGLFSAIRHNPRSFFIVIGTRMGENGFAYLYPVFCVSYVVTTLKMEKSMALWAVIIASAIQLVTIPFYGALSDRIGRKKVYLGGIIFSVLWLVPFFMLLDIQAFWAIVLGFAVGLGIAYPAMLSPQAAWYAELFDTEFRLAGFAFSRELGSLLAGGLAPFIATALYTYYHHWWPIVVYMGSMGVLTLIALALGPETVHKDIE